MYKKLLTLFIVLSFSSFINAQGYQRLDPVAVYTSESGQLYIVMEYNIGKRGCTHDKNSILIHPEEHSSEFLKEEEFLDLSFLRYFLAESRFLISYCYFALLFEDYS